MRPELVMKSMVSEAEPSMTHWGVSSAFGAGKGLAMGSYFAIKGTFLESVKSLFLFPVREQK